MYKLRTRYSSEIDAIQLQQILGNLNCTLAKSLRGFRNMSAPSLDLCRALLALRDPALGGRLSIEHVPALMSLLKFWKVRFFDLLIIIINFNYCFVLLLVCV